MSCLERSYDLICAPVSTEPSRISPRDPADTPDGVGELDEVGLLLLLLLLLLLFIPRGESPAAEATVFTSSSGPLTFLNSDHAKSGT